MSSDPSTRLAEALEAIDAANAADPNEASFDGEVLPREVLHARRMTHWLHRLNDDPSEEQQVAARASHLRRWIVPRVSYPSGRVGYLRWRADQKERHAREVAELLAEVGYSPGFTARVGQLILKERRRADTEVQSHEDALCLTFLELDLSDIADRLGSDKTVGVLSKTIRKMSSDGIDLGATIKLDPALGELIQRAIADASSASD